MEVWLSGDRDSCMASSVPAARSPSSTGLLYVNLRMTNRALVRELVQIPDSIPEVWTLGLESVGPLAGHTVHITGDRRAGGIKLSEPKTAACPRLELQPGQ